MKFGMLHLFESPEGRSEQEIIGEQLDLMQAGEEMGFDSIWPAEHHFTEYGYCVSTSLALAAVARVTKRIRLGTGIVVLPFHNPIRVAEEFAFIDLMSGGRLDFGIGRGYQPIEFAGFGVDQTQSRSIAKEATEIIVQAWTQDRVTYHGEHFHIENVSVRPKPLQKPHPPIWMAGVSPDTFEMIGRLGYNLLYSPAFTPEKITPVQQRLADYRKALIDNGHDPATKRIAALRMVYVADSNEQARRDFEQPVLWWYRTIARYVSPPKGEEPVKSFETFAKIRDLAAVVDFNSLVEGGGVIAGDPDYVCRRIEEVEREYGFTDLLVWTRMGGLDPHKVMRSMELMERHVMPHFRTAAEPSPAR